MIDVSWKTTRGSDAAMRVLKTYTAQNTQDGQQNGAEDPRRKTLLGTQTICDERRARVVVIDSKA